MEKSGTLNLIPDLGIMLGGGFFVGTLLTLALTYGLFFVGAPISALHSLFFIAGSLIWSFAFFSPRIDPVVILLSHVVFYLLFAGFGLFASQLYSTNWDGVRFSKEVVIGLSCEWNPVLDKGFEMREGLAAEYPELREGDCVSGGHKILAGTILWSIATRLFHEYESGKVINIMYVFAGLLLLYGMLQKLRFGVVASIGLALLCVLNPVVSSELFSFTYDGQIAVLTAILAILTLSFLRSFSWLNVSLFGVVAVLTIASKISGIGLVALFGFILCVRLAVYGYQQSKTSRIYLLVSCFILIILALIGPNRVLRPVMGSRAESYAYSNLSQAYDLKNRFGRGVIRKNPEFGEMNGLEQFFASRFAVTRFSVAKPQRAPVFGIDTEGLRVYANAISSPFTGGFGPVFPLCFLMGSICILLALITKRRAVIPHAALILVIFVSLYFAPSLLPRWSHQGWLIPVIGLMALYDRRSEKSSDKRDKLSSVFSLTRENKLYRSFAWVTMTIIFLNCLTVLGLQVTGYLKDRTIINTQLDLIAQLDQPVKVEYTRYTSTRTWLIERGIDYQLVEDVVPPYIALHKTDTRIAVPESVFDDTVKVDNRSGTVLFILEDLNNKVDHSRDLHLNHALYER